MQTQYHRLKVAHIIENDAALTPASGDRLFLTISEPLKKNEDVIIDFSDIRFITSAFLNASIGQLYAHYSSDFIKEHLQVNNLATDDLILLARVVERAKEYFSDKTNIEDALGKAFHS